MPARKVILIFHIYMRYLFGEKKESPEHRKKFANLKYAKEFIDFHLHEKVPRHLLKTSSPVEAFYKRNMNSKHPIPNIIVVGILRVLLSTCPNTKKNKTGGVQIHREWSSCIKLFLAKEAEFDGFKPVFDHTALKEAMAKQPEEGKEPFADDDIFEMDDYRYENDRHRIITAMIISDLFIYMLKHFKSNCIN